MTNRKSLKDEVWLSVAFGLARLGTCARRQVGTVFLDANGHVLSTGYNGTAPGAINCTDKPCAGAGCPSGTGLELCEAIHAEQNAISQCGNTQGIDTVYCTDSPCIHCVKMLATTSARRVVFAREYPHPASKNYWLGLGRQWDHIPTADGMMASINPGPPWQDKGPSVTSLWEDIKAFLAGGWR